jgi:uncharacterized protein YjbI with pentapeptide repeats
MEAEMRIGFLAIALLIAVFCLGSPAHAANPDHMQRLLEVRSCVGCDLSAADLKNADLRGVNLSGANLKDADLRRANMMATNLKDANLRGANLSGAQMIVVDLTGADLKDADVTNVVRRQVKLCQTTIPSGKVVDQDC